MPYAIMKGIKRNPNGFKPVELVNVGTEESPQWALLITGDIDVDIDMATEGIATAANQTSGDQKTKWVDESENVLGGTTPAKVSVDLLTASPKSSTITVEATATPLPTTPLVGRKKLIIMNTSNINVYLTDSEGTGAFTIPPDIPLPLNAPDTVVIYAKVTSGTASVDILELK